MTDLERAIASNLEVAAGLEHLTEAIVNGIPRDTKRWRRTTAVLVAVFVLTLLIGYTQWQRFNRGITCVAEQLAEHRQSNQETHDRLMRNHGLNPVEVHGDLPGPIAPDEVVTICRPFYVEST